jgi:two-component sensor histidine kinase
LQALATAPAVTNEDWPRFYEQAKAALESRAYLVLVDATGRRIINTHVLYGEEPTYTGDPGTLKRMLASKGPVVSDLFVSLVVKKPVYNISIPVLQDGTVRYVMSLGLRPDDLARTLDTLKLNQAWVTTIWDRDNAVLARSRDHDRFLGSKVPSTLRQRAMSQAVLKATNLDGEEVLLAVTTSKLSDWDISVNVPVAIAEAQLRSILWLWGLASLTMLAVATVLGLLIGRHLGSALIRLAQTAQASGETILPVLTKVQEVNAVGRILHQTRERQNLLLREVSHRVKHTLGTDPGIAQRRELVIERLHALARAQDVLIKGDWSSIPLADIIASELAPFVERITISGPPVSIKQDVVQSLTLVLHELLTNAVKYGSLSDPAGRVAVSWRTENGDEPSFLFEWREFGGPNVGPPSKPGLGTRLLQQQCQERLANFSMKPRGLSIARVPGCRCDDRGLYAHATMTRKISGAAAGFLNHFRSCEGARVNCRVLFVVFASDRTVVVPDEMLPGYRPAHPIRAARQIRLNASSWSGRLGDGSATDIWDGGWWPLGAMAAANLAGAGRGRNRPLHRRGTCGWLWAGRQRSPRRQRGWQVHPLQGHPHLPVFALRQQEPGYPRPGVRRRAIAGYDRAHV